MTRCVGPIQTLTTPPEITNEEPFDNILTVELTSPAEEPPSPETIAKLLDYVSNLYTSVGLLSGRKDLDRLSVIYAASGSPQIRFDFKGLGEPIKQIKELLVEAWQRYRHRKAEDLRENSNAVLESLRALEAIESKCKTGTLPPDQGAKLRSMIINAAVGLFKQGAFIREIVPVEYVDNQKILQDFQRKLLPPPPPAEKSKRKRTTKTTKRTKGEKPKPEDQ